MIKKLSISLFIMMGIFFTSSSFAIESIELSIENILYQWFEDKKNTAKPHLKFNSIKQINLTDASLQINVNRTPASLILNLQHIQLPEPYDVLQNLIIECSMFELNTVRFICRQGHFSFAGLFNDINKIVNGQFNLNYEPKNDTLKLNISDMNVGSGSINLTLTFKHDQWFVETDVSNLEYNLLSKLIKPYLSDKLSSIEDTGFMVSFSGHLSGFLNQSDDSHGLNLNSANLKGYFKNIRYTLIDDMAENLSFLFDFDLKQKNNSQFSVSLKLNKIQGEVFQSNIYVAFTGNESFETQLDYNSIQEKLHIKNLEFISSDIVNFHSTGLIDLTKDNHFSKLNSTLKIIHLDQFNDLYLRNILEGTDYEGIEIQGVINGVVDISSQGIRLDTTFKDLSFSYNDKVHIIDLNGQLYWNNYEQLFSNVPNSSINWHELILNKLPFGSAQLDFKIHKHQLELLNEVDIPLFDGALHINTLHLASEDSSMDVNTNLSLAIDGMIRPISLNQVSNHFGWPELDGKLSAVIPYTTYSEHFLKVGGALMMQVFDGTIIIKDLEIEQPLSDQARLFANIDLLNLNLQSLTKTYNFGEIEGRIEGKLSNLTLDAWQPVEFDAFLRTPVNDKSRHRISQRAIDNLSSLGGASGILSRSFLSIFETFGYDKLGLSCKLKNGTCIMDGIERKSNKSSAYYIVKGGGIPRIDVMGFQRDVDWEVLTSRLQAIQSANEAVIE